MFGRDIVLILVIIGFVIGGLVFVTPAWAENRRLEEKLAELERLNEEKQECLNQKNVEIVKLSQHDPVAIELVLRERFAYCRPAEKIIQLQKSQLDQRH